MYNDKNRLHEFLRDLGYWESRVTYHTRNDGSGAFTSRVEVNFADGRVVQATGEGGRKTEAEIAASTAVLKVIHDEHPDLEVDWDEIFVEAQAGDALIKLGAYLHPDLDTAADKSRWLQKMESDDHLISVFDHMQASGDPDVAIFGQNLGNKRKATFVEALVWRKFGSKWVTDAAKDGFGELASFLRGK
ncbi:MAG: putative dsRNA-binding protein [Bacteroidota bacterium]